MEQKYYQNTHGRESTIEHTYTDYVNGGFQIRYIGFEGDNFDTTIWVHPNFVKFLEADMAKHYTENPITVDSDPEDFFWFVMEVTNELYSLYFNEQHPGWQYARIIADYREGQTVGVIDTTGLTGW